MILQHAKELYDSSAYPIWLNIYLFHKKNIFIQFSSTERSEGASAAGSERATIQLAGSFWPMDVKHVKDSLVL